MPGKPVRRTPMKPVSFMRSRMSVNGHGRKWLQSPVLRAHFTFRLAGNLLETLKRAAERDARKLRRFIKDNVRLFGASRQGPVREFWDLLTPRLQNLHSKLCPEQTVVFGGDSKVKIPLPCA